MKEFYNHLIERITSEEAIQKYQNAGIPPVKFVDLFRGQYYNWEAFDTFPLPALLFEFSCNYDNNKEGTATITLHVLYEQGQDTSSISRSKENALKVFDFVTTTHLIVDELETPYTGKLLLINEEMSKDDAIVNVHLLTYTCKYTGRNQEQYDYAQGEEIKQDGRIRRFFES